MSLTLHWTGGSKYLIFAAGGLGAVAAIWLMRSRKKGKIYITKEKFIPSNQASSKKSSVSFADAEEGAEHDEDHPDGPNIGFGSDPSWFRKDMPQKTDLLHTGTKGGKLVVVMVGLPGSGKTFMARKVSRFLRWISYRTRVYSLAKYRCVQFILYVVSFSFVDSRSLEPKTQTFLTLKMRLIIKSGYY